MEMEKIKVTENYQDTQLKISDYVNLRKILRAVWSILINFSTLRNDFYFFFEFFLKINFLFIKIHWIKKYI